MRELLETPEKIVKNGLVVDYGIFKTPFRNLNILDARIFGEESKVPRFLRKFRLKEWQHFAIINEDIFMGFVITDTHYMGMSFCYILERDNGNYTEYHKQATGFVPKVSRELWGDECNFKLGAYHINIENCLTKGYHKVHIDIKGTDNRPAIKAELELTEDLNTMQPLIPVLPIKPNRPLYTHKMPCPVKGEISIGERQIVLDDKKDIALLDVQKTFYPFNSFWRWATFAGYDKEGRLLAINLVQNMIKDDEKYNENALWVDGKLTLWGAARFSFNEDNVLDTWTIKTTDGKCNLKFSPIGERAEKINLGLIVSNYHQPYGTYSGTVEDADGTVYEVEELFGVTEHHLARF